MFAQADTTLTLFVKAAEGTLLTLHEIDPQQSIASIKQKVLYSWAIAASNQILLVQGQQLDEAKSISDYGIGDQSLIHLLRKGLHTGDSSGDGGTTEYCTELHSTDVVRHLAAAASDVFEPGTFKTGGKASLQLLHAHEFDGAISWATYRFRGGVILAFMGSRGSTQKQQADQVLAGGGPDFFRARTAAIAIGWEFKPDFVTGHGLGGSLAECVCSYCGVPGAAFSPLAVIGSEGPMGDPCLADGRRHTGVQFQVVASKTDRGVLLGTGGDYEKGHIVKPEHIRWARDFPDEEGEEGANAMFEYVQQIGQLP